MLKIEAALQAAVKSGGLIRYEVDLDQDEFQQRRLWLRPEINELLKSSGNLESKQREAVKAALRRFVVGGVFTVVTANCRHSEVSSIGDIRELKGDPPPFIELRFKPPKHELQFFGRFVGTDALVLTTYGMKSLTDKTGRAALSVPAERERCRLIFQSNNLDLASVPADINRSITNASFL